VDIRLTDDGRPVVLEVNANPYLERTSAFALAALQAGMGYTMLINRIAEIAGKRCEPTPFLTELQKNRAGRTKIRRKAAKLVESIGTESDTGGHGSEKASKVAKNEDAQSKPAE
jgi:D-alanine-D-alanine ligase